MTGARVVWGAVAALLGALFVLAAVVPEDPPAAGPAGSSFSTEPGGTAAYLALLESAGFQPVQAKRPLPELRLAANDTLVVLGSGRLGDEDAAAVAEHAGRDGRVVVGGRRAAGAVAAALGWRMDAAGDGPGAAEPLAPVPEVAGVSALQFAGRGRWTATGPALPVAGTGGQAVAAVGTAGGGRVMLLADAGPLENSGLVAADNARFALNLAGPPGSRVVFAEAIHGFGPRRGLAALPDRWRWALAGFGLAAVVWVAARVRRFGPPQPEARPLPPPRAAYVDALAATLARTRRPDEAAAPVREAARRLVAARAGLRGAPPAAAMAEAAARVGLPDDEAAALADGGGGPAGIVAAGRALARLRGGSDRRTA